MTISLSTWPEHFGYTSSFFSLPNLRMFAAVAGPEDGPLVILLHGFPECAYSWRYQIGALSQKGFRVVAPDQRGYGLTEKHGPYTMDILINDVVNLIRANGHKSAFIVGHDWGAAVAWHLVEVHPDRINRMAILNLPHPRLVQQAILGGNWRQTLRSWYIFLFQLPWIPELGLSLFNYRSLRRAFQTSSLPHTFTSEDIDLYIEGVSQPRALSAMLNWYRVYGRRTAIRMGRAPALIPRIQIPTLILWGDQDIALEKSLADKSAKLLDNGRLVHFPDATHWVHEDKPEQVSRLLIEYFTYNE